MALNADGQVAAYSHNFVKPTSVAAPTPKLQPKAAKTSAAKLLGGEDTGHDSELKYYALEDNTLALTHAVELKLDNGHTVRSFVDANTGEVHGLFDYTSNLSVRPCDTLALPIFAYTSQPCCSSAFRLSRVRIRPRISSS